MKLRFKTFKAETLPIARSELPETMNLWYGAGTGLIVTCWKKIFPAMKFYSRGIFLQIAFRALILAICVSVAFGNAAQVLLPSLSPIRALVANESSPAQPSSVPEEAPPEAPDSNEPIEEGEMSFFALRRTSQKAARFYVQQSNLARFSGCYLLITRALLAGSQTSFPKFEHCYRNGCGAHLRC